MKGKNCLVGSNSSIDSTPYTRTPDYSVAKFALSSNNDEMIVLAYLSLFALSFMDNSRGPLIPLVQNSLQISSSTVSFIFSGASLASAFINFVLPKLQSKIEVHKLYFFSLFLMPISAACWSFSKSNPFFFYLAPLLYGLGAGGVGTFCNIYVIAYTSESKRQKALSFLHSTYGIASFLAPLLITLLLTYFDWPIATLILSIPSLLVSAPLLKRKAIIPLHEEHRPEMPWHLLWVSCIFMLAIMSEIFISSRLVNYLYRDEGYTLEHANYYLSLFFALLVTGRLVFSFVHFSLSKPLMLQASFFFTVLLSLAGIMIHPVFFAVTGLTISWFFPVGINWLREAFHREYFPLVSMIMSFNSVALLSMHFAVGELTDVAGLKRLMILPVVFSIAAMIVLQIFSKKMVSDNFRPNK